MNLLCASLSGSSETSLILLKFNRHLPTSCTKSMQGCGSTKLLWRRIKCGCVLQMFCAKSLGKLSNVKVKQAPLQVDILRVYNPKCSEKDDIFVSSSNFFNQNTLKGWRWGGASPESRCHGLILESIAQGSVTRALHRVPISLLYGPSLPLWHPGLAGFLAS